MHSLPNPPGVTETVHAQCALVLAPHYDDEILGCGGLITNLVAAGSSVRVLFLSDSSGGDGGEAVEDGASYSATRRQEAEQSIEVLASLGDIQVADHLNLPDGRLDHHRQELARSVGSAIAEHRPDLLLVTSPLEVSRDHVAAFLALHDLLTGIRPGDALEPLARELRILTYEVNHLQHPDLLVDVSDRLGILARAMACHASQQARHDYWGAYVARAKFRAFTLPPGTEAVETYRRLRLEDFTNWGLSELVQRLGGRLPKELVEAGPLVTVIVRTYNRPELLAEALASITAGIYRNLEVVVVNDGGEPPELPKDYGLELRLVNLPSNQGRAAAANAGVDEAQGHWIAFLDDDDVVEPDHYAVLTSAASAAGVRVVYSDAAVGVYELDGERGWGLTERRLPYSRDFQPDLLLVDNYIPFHTLLIERSLFAEVGRFDTGYEIFEDWELLIRLAKKTPFHHLRRVTCEYRQFRGGGHHVLGDRPRERADFLSTKARVITAHGDALGPETVARVVDRLRAEAVTSEESARHERERRERAEVEHHQTRGALQASEEFGRQLETLEARARQELDGLRPELEAQRRQVSELHAFQEQQSQALQQAYDEIERLNGVIRAMEGTRAWQLHQRLQGWKS